MYIAISVVFHCCLVVSSLHGLDLLAKMAKKHQHSLHGVALLHSYHEPEPVSLVASANNARAHAQYASSRVLLIRTIIDR